MRRMGSEEEAMHQNIPGLRRGGKKNSIPPQVSLLRFYWEEEQVKLIKCMALMLRGCF